MTKESHLAHIIIASSDGYFINQVFTDSHLKKTSKFYRVDYLNKRDVVEWLLNLEKYSKIKDFTLTEEDADKIWDTVGGSIANRKLEIMLKALIEGDIKLFEKMLRKVVLAVFSYHDFGEEPEKVYHALVAGLLIWISNTHDIKSNRESGYGRYDITIIPHDPTQTGYVIEFKTVDKEDNETVDTAAAAALAQIEEKKYQTDLIERGIGNIKKLAIVFSGKDVYIKE